MHFSLKADNQKINNFSFLSKIIILTAECTLGMVGWVIRNEPLELLIAIIIELKCKLLTGVNESYNIY